MCVVVGPVPPVGSPCDRDLAELPMNALGRIPQDVAGMDLSVSAKAMHKWCTTQLRKRGGKCVFPLALSSI